MRKDGVAPPGSAHEWRRLNWGKFFELSSASTGFIIEAAIKTRIYRAAVLRVHVRSLYTRIGAG